MTNLMTPRYLVIADYPNSNYEIGQIIELSVPKDAGGWDMVTLANNEEIMPKYPHLFRLLHWSEYRDEKEMPEYLKYQIGTKTEVCKVIGYKDGQGIIDDTHVITLHDEVLPATATEYIEYIKKLIL